MSATARIVIAGGPRTGKTSRAWALDYEADEIDRSERCAACSAGASRRYPTHTVGAGEPPECPTCGAVPLVRHTDDLIHLGWSEASAAAALWFDAPGPWIVEGVAAVRALRKWLAAHPEGRPCDVVYWLAEPVVPVTPGQAAMARGCATVWHEIRDELARRGVEIATGREAA